MAAMMSRALAFSPLATMGGGVVVSVPSMMGFLLRCSGPDSRGLSPERSTVAKPEASRSVQAGNGVGAPVPACRVRRRR